MMMARARWATRLRICFSSRWGSRVEWPIWTVRSASSAARTTPAAISVKYGSSIWLRIRPTMVVRPAGERAGVGVGDVAHLLGDAAHLLRDGVAHAAEPAQRAGGGGDRDPRGGGDLGQPDGCGRSCHRCISSAVRKTLLSSGVTVAYAVANG